MSTAIAPKGTEAEALELALLGDDLSRLTPPQRLYFYNQTCTSLGLNPLTKPFAYITLNGKLTLYAKRDCTDQLRKIHGVSVTDLADYTDGEGTYVVTAKGRDRDGRVDAAKGAVFLGQMKGEMRANAIMKAETKAKRRLTLSLCGLGMLDETEVDLPGAVLRDTDVVHSEPTREPDRPKPTIVAPQEGERGAYAQRTGESGVPVAREAQPFIEPTRGAEGRAESNAHTGKTSHGSADTQPPAREPNEAELIEESRRLFLEPERDDLIMEIKKLGKKIPDGDKAEAATTYLGMGVSLEAADISALADLKKWCEARVKR